MDLTSPDSRPEPVVESAVLLRVPQSLLPRTLPLAGLAISAALSFHEFSDGQVPWGIGLAAIWVLQLLMAWSLPVVEASNQGVRLKSRQWMPWSDVAEVVAAPDNGWKHQEHELVLRSGDRKSLASLSRENVLALDRLFRDYTSSSR